MKAMVDQVQTSCVHEGAESEQTARKRKSSIRRGVSFEYHPVLSRANLQSAVDSWSVNWAAAFEHHGFPSARIAWKLSLKPLVVRLRACAMRLIQSQHSPT